MKIFKIIDKVDEVMQKEHVQELMGLFGTLYFGKKLITYVHKHLNDLKF